MAQSATMVGITRTRAIGTVSSYQETRSNLATQMHTDFDNVFFNQDEFGVTVSYIHYTYRSTVTYYALFDDPTQDVKVGSKTGILSEKPHITLSTSHMIQQPNLKDVIIINGNRFNIDSYEDDGLGVVLIYLIREGQGLN